MTPLEFCKYVTEGRIFDEMPTGEADHVELGREIWPKRYGRLAELAQEAIKQDKGGKLK